MESPHIVCYKANGSSMGRGTVPAGGKRRLFWEQRKAREQKSFLPFVLILNEFPTPLACDVDGGRPGPQDSSDQTGLEKTQCPAHCGTHCRPACSGPPFPICERGRPMCKESKTKSLKQRNPGPASLKAFT